MTPAEEEEMEMTSGPIFWIMIASLVLFLAVALIVIVGGYMSSKQQYKRIKAGHGAIQPLLKDYDNL